MMNDIVSEHLFDREDGVSDLDDAEEVQMNESNISRTCALKIFEDRPISPDMLHAVIKKKALFQMIVKFVKNVDSYRQAAVGTELFQGEI